MKPIDQRVNDLQLEPHPEGGFYRETYRADGAVVSPVHGQARSPATHIDYLLPEPVISAFHRVVHDEIWHWYEGAPLELVQLTPEGAFERRVELGPGTAKPAYHHVIPGGYWQAARSLGAYTLAGCTVSPGFDFADFEFLRDAPTVRDAVLEQHPEWKTWL